MRKLIRAFVFLGVIFAFTNCHHGIFSSCSAGDFRCSGNVSQICNADESWENYQNCGSIGERCSTAPANCGGYSGIACCY